VIRALDAAGPVGDAGPRGPRMRPRPWGPGRSAIRPPGRSPCDGCPEHPVQKTRRRCGPTTLRSSAGRGAVGGEDRDGSEAGARTLEHATGIGQPDLQERAPQVLSAKLPVLGLGHALGQGT
jgi:hypothetical protein